MQWLTPSRKLTTAQWDVAHCAEALEIAERMGVSEALPPYKAALAAARAHLRAAEKEFAEAQDRRQGEL